MARANNAKYQLDMNMTAIHNISPVNDSTLRNSHNVKLHNCCPVYTSDLAVIYIDDVCTRTSDSI